AERDGLDVGQLAEIRRQVLAGGHRCTVEQHGNYPDASTETAGNLGPHEVRRVVETALRGGVPGIEPASADEDQHHVAILDALVDPRHEIDAGGDVVEVHENRCVPIDRRQVFVQATGVAGSVFAAVADENGRHE